MELRYRGVKYQSNSLNLAVKKDKTPILRKKLVKSAINYKFPTIEYCKQLFFNQGSPIYNREQFWHRYQSQFLEKCWQLNPLEQLNFCWQLTLKIEKSTAPKKHPSIKLKYRGVTYYR